jgi:hypothetical protein
MCDVRKPALNSVLCAELLAKDYLTTLLGSSSYARDRYIFLLQSGGLLITM